MMLEQKAVTSFPSPYCLLYLEGLRTIQLFTNSQEKNRLGNGAPWAQPFYEQASLNQGSQWGKGQISLLHSKKPCLGSLFGDYVFPYLPPPPLSSSVLLCFLLIIKIFFFPDMATIWSAGRVGRCPHKTREKDGIVTYSKIFFIPSPSVH